MVGLGLSLVWHSKSEADRQAGRQAAQRVDSGIQPLSLRSRALRGSSWRGAARRARVLGPRGELRAQRNAARRGTAREMPPRLPRLLRIDLSAPLRALEAQLLG